MTVCPSHGDLDNMFGAFDRIRELRKSELEGILGDLRNKKRKMEQEIEKVVKEADFIGQVPSQDTYRQSKYVPNL